MWYIYTKEYYSTFKRKELLCYNMDEPQGHYPKLNKPITKEQIIREMQIKTTMRYNFIPVRMAIINKSTNKCWQGGGKREP